MEANPRSDERTVNGPKSDQGEVCNFPGTLNVIIVKIWGSLENKTEIPRLHPGDLATHSHTPQHKTASFGTGLRNYKGGGRKGSKWSPLKHKLRAKTLIPKNFSGSSPNSQCLVGSYIWCSDR